MINYEKKNLIVCQPKGKIVFIGDTHGDLEATQKILADYIKPEYKLVFLGDYVDRGRNSKENADLLLEMQNKHPEQAYMVLGNHETFQDINFYPADFWFSLSNSERDLYGYHFDALPLVFSCGPIIALHGIPPLLSSLEEIDKIQKKDLQWHRVVWGDFSEEDKEETYWLDELRPRFGAKYFYKAMDSLGKKILIRSHQQEFPEKAFNNRCLTIFTSNAYQRKRTIAIADMSKPIETLDNLEILEI